MKVLFGVSNENITSLVVNNYQQKFKEIITSKNVYYFNAIIKELQRDKSYDAIVIGEDLEPLSNNNYDAIDKFLFEKLDSISDEASKPTGEDIPIIFICSDRRTKSDGLLVKLFGIGVYDALIGNDRSINMVCSLINKPRNKKEAKKYYKIDTEEVDYKPETEQEVGENEIKNILSYYKKIGNNEKKCVEAFDNIANQYDETQLRIIIKFLPLEVKAVLEQNSSRYQKLMLNGTVLSNGQYKPYGKPNNPAKPANIEFMVKDIGETKMSEPVIIPSTMHMNNAQVIVNDKVSPQMPVMERQNVAPEVTPAVETIPVASAPVVETPLDMGDDTLENDAVEPQKRGRGRPKKERTPEEIARMNMPKRGRGRPRKIDQVMAELEAKEGPVSAMEINAEPEPILEEPVAPVTETIESAPEVPEMPVFEKNPYDEMGQMVTSNPYELSGVDPFAPITPAVEPEPMVEPVVAEPEPMPANLTTTVEAAPVEQISMETVTNSEPVKANNPIAGNGKIAAFVGTTKNGTSFVVNNLAQLLAQSGVRTAVIDLTQNKNAYYMFTNNDPELMKLATDSLTNLSNGNPRGIEVNKNLTVFTGLPGDITLDINPESLLKTASNTYEIILLDCDYKTDSKYFVFSNEIYLVQTMDAFTIQPLTQFLSDLKLKNLLDESKLRVVINKYVKMKRLDDKMIIGGMSKYNEPSMTLQRDLFNSNTIQYVRIPFEEGTYARYLESIAMCQLSLNGYSQNLIAALEDLKSLVYPLVAGARTVSGAGYSNYGSSKKKFFGNKPLKNTTDFSSDVNDTLNKMRLNQ